jgi:protein gp37
MIDWVIVGGESGPGARPMHPDWARSLREQCAAADVPFLFKQWGEWTPAPEVIDASGQMFHRFDDGTWVQRIGKNAAGRLLDGRTHDSFPEVL